MKKQSVEYYLSKGFDQKTAEYFSKGRKKAISVKPTDNYMLIIDFDNGEKRIFDVKPLLEKNTVFENLENYLIFNRPYIDEFNCIAWDIDENTDSNIVWNNKIDISSDQCYLESESL